MTRILFVLANYIEFYITIILCFISGLLRFDTDVDYLKNNLKVSYKTISNLPPRPPPPVLPRQTVILVTLTNTGNRPIPGYGFECYFCHDNFLFPRQYNTLQKRYSISPFNGGILINNVWKIEFVKGCMYKFSPISMTSSIPRGGSVELILISEPASVSRYDSFPNWYCTNSNKTVALQSTRDLSYVEDFDTLLNQQRGPLDWKSIPLRPQERFIDRAVDIPKREDECVYNIVPSPEKTEGDSGTFPVIKKDWKIVYDDRIQQPPRFIKHLIQPELEGEET